MATSKRKRRISDVAEEKSCKRRKRTIDPEVIAWENVGKIRAHVAALSFSNALEYLHSLTTSRPAAINSLAWHRWVRVLLQHTATFLAGSPEGPRITRKLKDLVRAGTGKQSLAEMRQRYGRLTLLSDRPLTPEAKETDDCVVRQETATTVPIRIAEEDEEEKVEEFFDPVGSDTDDDEEMSSEEEEDFNRMISSSSNDESDGGDDIDYEDDEEEDDEASSVEEISDDEENEEYLSDG